MTTLRITEAVSDRRRSEWFLRPDGQSFRSLAELCVAAVANAVGEK